jgi:hypothetical protein
VVTTAGLVFAATMSSFVFSDLRVIGQVGTTIGLGLLCQPDASPYGPRPAVRELLQGESEPAG